MKFLLFNFTMLIIFLFSSSFYAISDTNDSEYPLKPESAHYRVLEIANMIMQRNHYKPKALDDSLSVIIYDEFVKSLDFNRIYFLKSDINQFASYQLQMDDLIKSKNLNPIYDFFNLYIDRVLNRTEYAITVLDKGFDFTVDEYYDFDRSEAPWFESEKEWNKHWDKKVKYEVLNLVISGKDSSAYQTISKRYSTLQSQFKKWKSEDVFQSFMNAYAEALDPHSSYFSPRTSEDFKINMSRSFEGIGAQLFMENEYVTIRELISGGPAIKSKQINANDRIIAVGQGKEGELVDVIGWRIDDVVELIRGPKGTTVRLAILPPDEMLLSNAKTISLIRDKINLEDRAAQAELKTVPMGNSGDSVKVGVIELQSFYIDFEGRANGDPNYNSTTRDVSRLIRELKSKGMEALILDVRDNGGGSLLEAIELTGLFIDQGPVVQVRGRNGEVEVESDTKSGMLWEGPLGVLVNRYSASASEIFAAAVQDYGRGVILGERTFGKGTVQNLVDLKRFIPGMDKYVGQLKLTIAKFYRVDGSTTQMLGVAPDIIIPTTTDTSIVGESAQSTALRWDNIAKVIYTHSSTIVNVLPELKNNFSKRTKEDQTYNDYLTALKNRKKDDIQPLPLEKKALAEFKQIQKEKAKINLQKEYMDSLILGQSLSVMADLNQLYHLHSIGLKD